MSSVTEQYHFDVTRYTVKVKIVRHFRWIFNGEESVAHQPVLVSEN